MAIKLSDPKLPQHQLTKILSMWKEAHEGFGGRLESAVQSMVKKQETKTVPYSKLEPRM